jgi:hypothetical protein
VGDHDFRPGTSTASVTFRGKADTGNIELALQSNSRPGGGGYGGYSCRVKDATAMMQFNNSSNNNQKETSSDVTARSKRVCGRRKENGHLIGGRGSASGRVEI